MFPSLRVTVHGAAQAVFSAPCEGDSPIFAAETVDHWAKTPFEPRKLGQSPCERVPLRICRRRWPFSTGRAALTVFGLAALVLLLAPGCGRGGGPERVIVSGTVQYRGEPVQLGQIRFLPAEGTGAPSSGAWIIDGQYKVDARGGVPVGTHRVWIEAFPPPVESADAPPIDAAPGSNAGTRTPHKPLPAKFNTQTELRLTVESGLRSLTHDFDLTDW